jgi:hypothetical protein
VIPTARTYVEVSRPSQLARLGELAMRPDWLLLRSAYPQAIRVVTADRSRPLVGADFLVPGFVNLYVCDASVFPVSIGVATQATVMALAHRCATEHVAKRLR